MGQEYLGPTPSKPTDLITLAELATVPIRIFHGGNANYPRPDTNRPADWFGWVVPAAQRDIDVYHEVETASSAFVGPMDSYPAPYRAHSLRRLRSAHTGAAIRVRRAADSVEQDIGFTTAGDLDTAALLAFAGSDSAFVATWFDQSGNGRHLAQATAAAQPRIVNAGVVDVQGSKPALVLDGSNDYLADSAPGLYVAGSATVALVARAAADSADTLFGEVGAASSNSYRPFRIGAGSASPIWRGSVTAGSTSIWSLTGVSGDTSYDGSQHQLFFVDSGTAVAVWRDTVVALASTTVSRGAAPTLARTTLGAAAYDTPSGFVTGTVQELIAWGADRSADRAAVSSNQKGYWGTP